jgi:hypothetical protein
MVHQMSGETESTILSQMPFARGLQYQNQWYRLIEKQTLFRPGSEDKGLHVVL